jgi:kynurenine formamidase
LYFVDLSTAIMEKDDEPQATRLFRLTPREGAYHVEKEVLFVGEQSGRRNKEQFTLNHNSFPDQEFLSYERVETSVHTGTHLDAPYHYGSTCEGKPARTIDEVPLDCCYGPAVALDVQGTYSGNLITVQDIQRAAERLPLEISEGTIVLLHTGCDRLFGTPEYYTAHPGVAVDALVWLIDRGIRTIGIDAFSFDRPFKKMVQDYLQDGNQSHLWPAHIFGRRREYFQLEGLANLDALPRPYGFVLSCFPIKVRGAGAGWVRAVAIFEDDQH